MAKFQIKPAKLIVAFLIFGAFIALIESNLKAKEMGSLLFLLSFWVVPIEGCIALVAVAELSKGSWILPVKKELLSVYPLLLFISFLFILMGPQLNIYPWAGQQGIWLNKWFFMARNFILLLLAYIVSRKFAAESNTGGKRKNFYAVLYLLIFVTSQSMAAFDWVMPLAYPWISSLFGGYFFIESVYSGMALSGLLYFFLFRQSRKEISDELKKGLTDISTLTFSFGFLWAGFFYAQYLTIWYGNIPEETIFIVKRVLFSPFRELSYLTLLILFFIPFIILLSRRAKKNPYIVFVTSSLILAGIFLERFLFLAPDLSINIPVLILEFFLMAFLFVLVIINRDLFLPDSVK